MVRVVVGQLRHRIGRSLALLLGIFVAVTSFTVLTGTTEVSRLRAVGDVEESFRNAYDILVRPAGSTTELEADRDLVRNNFLSGLGGGISLAQYETIKDVAGIDVAAPIAVLGYQSQIAEAEVPLDRRSGAHHHPRRCQLRLPDHGPAGRAGDHPPRRIRLVPALRDHARWPPARRLPGAAAAPGAVRPVPCRVLLLLPGRPP
jgi:putative ABC transport system permease protein